MTIQEIYLIITALVALTVAFVKVQVATSSNTKNQAEFKTEMNAKTDKLDDELNNKVDKLERMFVERMESLQEKVNHTQLEMVEIKSDTKYTRESVEKLEGSINSLVQLFHQHVLKKDA